LIFFLSALHGDNVYRAGVDSFHSDQHLPVSPSSSTPGRDSADRDMKFVLIDISLIFVRLYISNNIAITDLAVQVFAANHLLTYLVTVLTSSSSFY